MKLNFAERLLVNNPIRAVVQRYYEGPHLRRMGGRLDRARVLEVGCGCGNAVPVVLEEFGAAQVCAVDLDPKQIQRAQHRLRDRRALLAVAGAEQLPFPDEYFDAVFDFGVLHHVPAWQSAVREIRRVLKPGGKFFFEEVTRQALERWIYRTFFEHPTENRFSEAEFTAELVANGIQLLGEPRRILAHDIFIGVGQRIEGRSFVIQRSSAFG